MSQKILKNEISGAYLYGITESFKDLELLADNNVHLPEIDPTKWYSYQIFIDTLKAIDSIPSARDFHFQSGVNFMKAWYEYGPGKEMIFSTKDWLYLNEHGKGYNSVVRGTPQEVGWCKDLYHNEEEGIAIIENVMPIPKDILKGIFYGGCIIFDDTDYVEVDCKEEPYPENAFFTRSIITIRYRFKTEETKKISNEILSLCESDSISLTDDEIKSLLWMYRGLKVKNQLETDYANSLTELQLNYSNKLLERQKEIEELHKNTKSSIEYASIIQKSILPDINLLNKVFNDAFILWMPRDIVGGDMYLFEMFNDGDEGLIMIIDCAGHGVPGAFVTMLVKAVASQILSSIENKSEKEDISPAKILTQFNYIIKHLLGQTCNKSTSNAGFDGGVLYYSKSKNKIRYAGAYTSLFILKDGEIEEIKGDKHSIGYRRSKINYSFSEHTIDINQPMTMYITTDGYLDQTGGEKEFSLGKKYFKQLLKEISTNSLEKQKQYLLQALSEYQGSQNRLDDVTVFGFQVS